MLKQLRVAPARALLVRTPHLPLGFRWLALLFVVVTVTSIGGASLRPAHGASQTFTVNVTYDDAPGGPCTHPYTGPGQECSLREAINAANATPDTDIINFNLFAGDTITVNRDFNGIVTSPGHALPAITQPVTIDGTTGANGWVGLDGAVLLANASGGPVGLYANIGGVTIKGMVITAFKADAIRLTGNLASAATFITGNYWIDHEDDGLAVRDGAGGRGAVVAG